MAKLKSNPRQTMLVISLGFSFIFLIGLIKGYYLDWAIYLILLCTVSGLLSLSISKKIEWLWFQLARLLSFIVPNILLSLIYFLILVPLATLNRLFSKQELLQLKNPETSVWKIRNSKFSSESLEKPW